MVMVWKYIRMILILYSVQSQLYSQKDRSMINLPPYMCALALLSSSLAMSTALSSPLILGSGSATRKAILQELGLKFEVHKPGIDEKAIRRKEPAELVLALGRAKAAALLEGERGDAFRRNGALVLTADQVVVCDGRILEKPDTEEEARHFISGYAQYPPQTVGSCVITDPRSGRQWSAVDKACVTFLPIPDAVIDELIDEGEVFFCAGGLMVEHALVQPYIERMDGSIDSVMGLCKATVMRLLQEANAARADDSTNGGDLLRNPA